MNCKRLADVGMHCIIIIIHTISEYHQQFPITYFSVCMEFRND